MKKRFLYGVLIGLLAVVMLGLTAESQTRRDRRPQRGAICFDPTVACRTTANFEPYDLPFRIPASAVIWESEPFYAIILKSVRYRERDCERRFIPEAERLEAQALFPRRKVFATRCGEPGNIFYSNTGANVHFMGIYGGRTRVEALRMLEDVRATGRFPGANIRQMYAGFNGT